jgi:hypothetical protein
LGKTLFTAANVEMSEEEKKQTDYRMAVVNLPNSLGQRMLDNPDSLIDTETFKDFFKGLYITTSFGSGTIIKVAYTYFFGPLPLSREKPDYQCRYHVHRLYTTELFA